MGDNNKKTFADLFSDSIDEVQENVEENELTFDRLFDNLSDSKEDNIEEDNNEKSGVNFSDILSTTSNEDNYGSVNDDTNEEDFSLEESVIEDDKSLNDVLEGNLFLGEENTDNNDLVSVNNDIGEDSNDFSLENVNDEESNLFFAEDKNDDKSLFSINNDLSEDSKVHENLDIDLVLDNDKNELKEENNLFFDDVNVLNDEDKEQNYVDEQEKVDEVNENFESNLFFNNENKEEQSEKNVFFNDNVDEVKEDINTELESNLFFEDNTDVKDNNIFFDNNENIINDESKKVEDKVVSSSPFFESDVMEEKVNSLLPDAILLDQKNDVNTNGSKIELDGVQHYNVKIIKKKPTLFKFLVGVVSYAIFIFLMLIGVALLVYVLDIKIRASKGDYSTPTFNAYVVLTGSMLPDIQVKDVVVTKKVDAELLNEGDIITFASADSRFLGTVITHRIIKKNVSKDGTITFQTKGDNNNVADNALVPAGNIYGKVILKIPKLGYLQDFLATQGGWIVVILIPCLAVISYDVVKLSKGLKKKKVRNVKVKK